MSNDIFENLPQGWELKTLGEVCELYNGYAFKSSSFMDEGIPVVRIGDIQNFEVNTSNSLKIEKNQEYENYKIQKGDLLIAMSGATTGKIGIYKLDDTVYLNQRVGNLKIKSDKILAEYRNFTLYALQDEIYKRAYGGAQPNISKGAIESLKIPLPPLETQQQIAEKLEKAFAHIDKASNHLKAVKADIPRLKASLLKNAFSSKLCHTEPLGEVSQKTFISRDISGFALNMTNDKENELPQGWELKTLKDICEINPKNKLNDDLEVSFVPTEFNCR